MSSARSSRRGSAADDIIKSVRRDDCSLRLLVVAVWLLACFDDKSRRAPPLTNLRARPQRLTTFPWSPGCRCRCQPLPSHAVVINQMSRQAVDDKFCVVQHEISSPHNLAAPAHNLDAPGRSQRRAPRSGCRCRCPLIVPSCSPSWSLSGLLRPSARACSGAF